MNIDPWSRCQMGIEAIHPTAHRIRHQGRHEILSVTLGQEMQQVSIYWSDGTH